MRITAGTFRSRTLHAPHGDATRPTSDRVREALFSMLTSRGGLLGARVLDLYAGTGALGLEALSRGASHVVFVERARDALRALRANVTSLGVDDHVRVVPIAVERMELEGPFDLVLADPPYDQVATGAVTRALTGIAGLMTPSAYLVLEHAKGDTAPVWTGLEHDETRRVGDTSLSFYRRC